MIKLNRFVIRKSLLGKNEVIEFGDTLENFYIHIRKTFETRLKPLKRRGRPRKLNL